MGRALILLKKTGIFGLGSVSEGRRCGTSRKAYCKMLILGCEKGVQVST